MKMCHGQQDSEGRSMAKYNVKITVFLLKTENSLVSLHTKLLKSVHS